MNQLPQFQQQKSEKKWDYSETPLRSIMKGVTYRFLGSTLTFILGWCVTGSLPQATAISVFEIVSKIIGYALHDRLWQRISWGKVNKS